jgi:hypothetical protein
VAVKTQEQVGCHEDLAAAAGLRDVQARYLAGAA